MLSSKPKPISNDMIMACWIQLANEFDQLPTTKVTIPCPLIYYSINNEQCFNIKEIIGSILSSIEGELVYKAATYISRIHGPINPDQWEYILCSDCRSNEGLLEAYIEMEFTQVPEYFRNDCDVRYEKNEIEAEVIANNDYNEKIDGIVVENAAVTGDTEPCNCDIEIFINQECIISDENIF